MTMQLSVGQRLASTVCATELIVLRADGSEVELSCGGAPVTTVGDAQAHAGTPIESGDGTVLGKRYVDPDDRFEFLCTKAGAGALAIGGTELSLKAAKTLPSSD